MDDRPSTPTPPGDHEQDSRDEPRTPGVPPHQPPFGGDEEDLVEEQLEESFPSSDPPSTGSPGLPG